MLSTCITARIQGVGTSKRRDASAMKAAKRSIAWIVAGLATRNVDSACAMLAAGSVDDANIAARQTILPSDRKHAAARARVPNALPPRWLGARLTPPAFATAGMISAGKEEWFVSGSKEGMVRTSHADCTVIPPGRSKEVPRDQRSWRRAEGPKYRPSKESGGSVHEEDVAIGDDAAALPDGQRAAMAVALTRVTQRHSVDADGAAETAYGLTGERQNVLQHRHTAGQVIALGKERGNVFRRSHDDQIIELELGRRLDGIETDRHARAGVPDEPWRHVDRARKRRGGDAKHHCDERCAAAGHASVLCRRSQADVGRAYIGAALRPQSGGCEYVASDRVQR